MTRTFEAPSTALRVEHRPPAVDVLAPVFVVLYLLIAFTPFEVLVNVPGSVSSYVLPALGLCVLALTPTERLARIPISLPLLGFVIWAALSVLWSDDPASTIFVIRSEIFPLVMVALVAGTIRPRMLAKVVLWTSLSICAWSLLISLALPTSRVAILGDTLEQQFGFRGTFGHKNDLGVFVVLTLAIALPLLRIKGRRWILGALVLLALSTRSATAGSGLLALTFLWAWMLAIGRGRSQRDRRLLILTSVTSAIVALLSAFRLLPILLTIYDKDLTFSGRTTIWSATIDFVGRQPFTGYGYGGVFTEIPTPLTIQLWNRIGFEAAHTHNGAVEVLLELGIIGLVLMVAFVVGIYRVSARVGSVPDDRRYELWGVLFMTSLLVMALAEPLLGGPFLGYMAILWALMSNLENEQLHPDRRQRTSTF